MGPPMDDRGAGNRVVQLGDDVPTAFASKLLADLDFEVVMVEDVGAASPLRNYGTMPQDRGWADSPAFRYSAQGKRSVALALDHPRGRQLVGELLAGARVVLVGPEPLRVLGGAEFLNAFARDHPDVVVAVATRYGLSGPKSSWAGTDLTTFFSGGEGETLGAGLNQQSQPDRPPVAPAEFITDHMTGLNIAVGVLAALHASRNGASGQVVDVSGQEAQLALNHLVPMRLVDGELETRHTRHFSYGGVFRCADGHVEILPLENAQWDGLRAIMGDPSWAADEELATGRGRADHGEKINAAIQQWAENQTRDELTRLGQQAGCPIAPFLAPDEIATDPQVVDRRALIGSDDGDGQRRVPRNSLADQILDRETRRTFVPALGADSADVLSTACDLDAADVRALVAQGVVVVATADMSRDVDGGGEAT